ncbi:MAG: metal-dependent hydrolase [Methanoregulaceae archaeon]
MYILCHLLAGVLTGVILSLWRKERWLILAAAIGSVLPDLVDKPLGHIILADSVNFGRIYTHSLVVLLLFFIAGVLAWWYYRSFIGIALALGLFSHQLLDLMWEEYWNWLWPFFGPFHGDTCVNFFASGFWQELTNPSEWLFAAAILLVLIMLFRHRGSEIIQKNARLCTVLSSILICVVVVCGMAIIICGIAGVYCILTGWDHSLNNALAGLLLIAGATLCGMEHRL